MLVFQRAQAALVNAGKCADIGIIRISCGVPVGSDAVGSTFWEKRAEIFFLPCNPVLVSVGEIAGFDIACPFTAVKPEAYLIPHFSLENFDIFHIECMATLDGGSRVLIGACFFLDFITLSVVEQCHERLFL